MFLFGAVQCHPVRRMIRVYEPSTRENSAYSKHIPNAQTGMRTRSLIRAFAIWQTLSRILIYRNSVKAVDSVEGSQTGLILHCSQIRENPFLGDVVNNLGTVYNSAFVLFFFFLGQS